MPSTETSSAGERRLQILLLEDVDEDAQLVERQLRRGGLAFELCRVESLAAFAEQLEAPVAPDLVLSDHSLRGFDGLTALELSRRRRPDVPFLFFSGTIGEERAIESLQRGAIDYVLKDRPERLVPAVRRALDESRLRREREQTEQRLRQAEEQLRQAQKLEALGRLAGGIAHDFNNLLTAIGGYADMLLDDCPVGGRARGAVEEILRAAERAGELTRQLLAFSRKSALVPRIVDLNALVENVGSMLRRLLGESVELRTSLDPQPALVLADPGQLEQVLVNLSVNARDAMPAGGLLRIETCRVRVAPPGDPRIPAPRPPGPYVRLTVADTGCGMDEGVAAQLFEPFFTTKEPGRGTGLGLSTVYGVVRQCSGDIEVHSAPGQGTSFLVHLPLAARAQAPQLSTAGERRAPRGSETVLLVEDEAPVRYLAREVLLGAGYAVLEAASAQRAVELCRLHGSSIDLVMADVGLPGMSGTALVEHLHELQPGLRVLYISGYLDPSLTRSGSPHTPRAFLPKPFRPDALLQKLREVLDGTG